jgi:hypothetical protein
VIEPTQKSSTSLTDEDEDMKPAANRKLSREFEVRSQPTTPPAMPFPRALAPSALSSRWRLLLVTDDRARLATWQAALPQKQWEITGLTMIEWLNRASERPYDLALVDVPATQLAEILVTLRGADWQIPILVEASRLPNDLSWAGVLPHYRAFPGTQAELLRFMKNRWLPVKAAPRSRQLL